jgi:hypothetical protein
MCAQTPQHAPELCRGGSQFAASSLLRWSTDMIRHERSHDGSSGRARSRSCTRGRGRIRGPAAPPVWGPQKCEAIRRLPKNWIDRQGPRLHRDERLISDANGIRRLWTASGGRTGSNAADAAPASSAWFESSCAIGRQCERARKALHIAARYEHACLSRGKGQPRIASWFAQCCAASG